MRSHQCSVSTVEAVSNLSLTLPEDIRAKLAQDFLASRVAAAGDGGQVLLPQVVSSARAAGVERAGCSVGPGAGPGGAALPPPGSALDPRPSAAYIPAPALRRDSVILSTEDDTPGDFCAGHSAAAEVLLHRTRQWYNCTEVNQATRRIEQGTRGKTGES